jgi:hypothetical protein
MLASAAMSHRNPRWPLRRPSAGVAGATMIAAALLLALTSSRSFAREPEGKSEPELVMPGNRAVHAGELIELRWTAADAVSELEILLSLDGGRHYTLCISPQLDPRRCAFLWRVPELGRGTLTMRIRFNRGGREIEGAPSAPLVVTPGGDARAEPLGLPVTPGERDSRPARDRGDAPTNRAACGASDAEEEDLPTHHRIPLRVSTAESASVTHRALDPDAPPGTFVPPRRTPLRA